MSEITHVIFDFDGTLADSQWYWTQLNLLVLQDRGYPVEEADAAFCKRVAPPERWAYLKEKFSLTEEQRPTFDEIMKFVDRYYQTENKCKPGVEEYLKALKSRGMTLAVFSATREESIRPGLSYLGIDGYFDYVFSSNNIGIGKSDPRSFLYCLEKMGAKAENCVMVEDALHSMKTAKSLGMTVYAIHEACNARDQEEILAIADKYGYAMTDFLD